MSLRKCHECGNDVSTEASACPKCGAKIKHEKKPMSKVMLLFLVVIVLGITASIVESEKRETTEKAKTPEQKAADAKENELLSRRITAAAAGMNLVKKNLRNPESVQWSDVFSNSDGSLICIDYRAQNGFGGYSRETIVFVSNNAYTDTGNWNKRCVNKSLIDVKKTALHFVK